MPLAQIAQTMLIGRPGQPCMVAHDGFSTDEKTWKKFQFILSKASALDGNTSAWYVFPTSGIMLSFAPSTGLLGDVDTVLDVEELCGWVGEGLTSDVVSQEMKLSSRQTEELAALILQTWEDNAN